MLIRGKLCIPNELCVNYNIPRLSPSSESPPGNFHMAFLMCGPIFNYNVNVKLNYSPERLHRIWRLGAQETGGWSCWPQTQVARAPQKPALPYLQPAMSPARHTQPQPKHPSHRARSSVEIIITVITNNNNNNNDNNNKVIIIKGRGGWDKNTKTLQKLIKMPQPLSPVKLWPHVTTHT